MVKFQNAMSSNYYSHHAAVAASCTSTVPSMSYQQHSPTTGNLPRASASTGLGSDWGTCLPQDLANAHVRCVSPGRQTKGASGGTFSTFRIGPYRDDQAGNIGKQAASESEFAHNIQQYCKVTVNCV